MGLRPRLMVETQCNSRIRIRRLQDPRERGAPGVGGDEGDRPERAIEESRYRSPEAEYTRDFTL